MTDDVNSKSPEIKWTQRSAEWASNFSASDVQKKEIEDTENAVEFDVAFAGLCYQQLLGPGQNLRHTAVPSALSLAAKLTCLISYSPPHFCYFDFSYLSLIKGPLSWRALISFSRIWSKLELPFKFKSWVYYFNNGIKLSGSHLFFETWEQVIPPWSCQD